MNTTIKARNRILSFALAICLLLGMVLAVPGPVEVSAAPSDASDGVDFAALGAGGIYYGTYDHAMDMGWDIIFGGYTNPYPSYENENTPVLWRVMGEEATGKLTLLSEYVLDTEVFNPSTSDGHVYDGSTIQTTLDTMSNTMFSGAEKVYAQQTDVITRMHNYNSDIEITTDPHGLVASYPVTTPNKILYLPWGKYNDDTVYWDAQPGNTISSTYRLATNTATLKEGAANTDDIRYWLRSPISASSDDALIVNTGGNVNRVVVNNSLGVRPAFQLNASSVIFTSEIKSTAIEDWETEADGTYYSDAAGVGANFKLTVVNDSIGTLSGMPSGSPTESLQSGETLYLNNLIPSQTSGDYTVNYKIVNDNGRTIDYYGFTDAEAVINLEIPGIANGSYTVYVWLQKNNEINSHEGTTPQFFTLTVDGSGDTYGIDLNPSAPLDFGIEEENYTPIAAKTVGITTTNVSSFDIRLNEDTPNTFEITNKTATGFDIAPEHGLPAGTYKATVTVAGNYAKPQTLDVKFEVTASSAPPVTLTPRNPLDGVEGETYTYNLSGDAAGGTPPYTFALDGGSQPLPSSLSLSAAGVISGTPMEDGAFPFTVKVTDSAGQTDTANYTIKIHSAGTDLPPKATPLQLTLEVGESKPVNVSLGYGADAATSADIASGNSRIATASPTQLGYSGSVTVTGQSKGQTTVRIDYSGGARDGDYDTVQVTVTDDSGGGNPGPDTYTVTVQTDGNGTANASPNPAEEHETVTLTATPHTGYQFKEWQVVSGSAVINDTESNPATFRMPGNAVTVKAVFEGSGGNPDPTPDPGGSSGGSSGSTRSGRSSSSGGSTYTPPPKTTLPASAFSWEGRTLTIDHDSISPLGLLSVQWDGKTLTRGTDYGVYQGSVIVRFSEDFMAAQSPGAHTIRVEFLNHTGETTVTVGETGFTGEVYDDHFVDTYNPNTGGDTAGDCGSNDNPNTGDESRIMILLALLGCFFGPTLAAWSRRKRV